MKILIPLDGSKFSEDILTSIKPLITSNLEVHLVQALDPEAVRTTWMNAPPTTTEVSGIWSPSGSLYARGDLGQGKVVETKDQAADHRHDEAMDYLRHVSAEHFNSEAHIEVIFDPSVVDALTKYAETEEIDLIAIATHGRTGFSKVLMGSVASALLKARIAPLFMVRPNDLR